MANEDEQVDKLWEELLQELRVTQTGIQILSGFLLTVAFTQRFRELSPAQHWTYLLAVSLATVATGLVIAPVASHRFLYRHHQKAVLLAAGDRLAKAGLVTLAMTVAVVAVLIFSVVVDAGIGVVAGVVALVFFALAWLVLPPLLARPERPADQAEMSRSQ